MPGKPGDKDQKKTVLSRNASAALGGRKDGRGQALSRDVIPAGKSAKSGREWEGLYKSFFHDNPAVMLIIDPQDGRIVDANRAAVRFYGYSARKLKTFHLSDISSNLPELPRSSRTGKAKAGRNHRALFTHRLAGGEFREVEMYSGPVTIGGKTLLYSIVYDTTERKQAVEALREGLKRAGAMFNAATESFALVDTEGTVLAANEAFVRRLGRNSDAIPGGNLYRFLSPVAADHLRELIREVVTGGHSLRFSDEREGRCYEHTLYPVFNSSGKVDRLVLCALDITDRKRSEDALRHSETILKSVFQAAPIGIGLVYDRVLGWTNDQLLAMLGYSGEELAEKSARILYANQEEFERVGREKYIKVRQGGTGVIETRWKCKDGSLLDVLLSSKAVDPEDLSSGVVFTALDITNRKRSEEALRHYRDKLEQRVRERTSELMVTNQALILEVEDRKRAEKALKDSEKRLSDIIEFLPDASFVIDREGRVIAWNKSMETMTGMPARDMLGKANDEYSIPFYGKRRPLLIDLALKKEQAQEKGKDLLTKEVDEILSGADYAPALPGGAAYLQGTARVLRNDDGELVGAVESIRDMTEMKHAEEALRESEERFSKVYRFNPGPMMISTIEEGRIVDVNERLSDVYGYSPEEMIGHTCEELQIWVNPQKWNHCIEKLKEKSSVRNCFVQGRTRSGQIRTILWSAEIIRLGGQEVFLSLHQDITEQKETEEKLWQSEERYRTIFENTLVGIFQSSPEGRYISVNPAFARMYGYESPENGITSVTDIGTQIFVDAEDRKHCLRILEEKGILERFETRTRRKDGSIMWNVINSRAVRDENGRFLYIEGIIEDITEQKRAEKALRDSERRLSDIIAFLPDATFVIDQEGRVIAWNKSMETMTGIPAKDMLGKGNYEYAIPFYGERRPLLIDLVFSTDEMIAMHYARSHRQGDLLFDESYMRIHEDRKKKVYLSATAAPLYDSQGNVVGAIESIRDITERKCAEEDLRYRDAILEVASFAAERFLKAPSWETDIQEILARLGAVTGATRVYLFENHATDDGSLATSLRHEWFMRGMRSGMGNQRFQSLSIEKGGFRRWATVLENGGHIFSYVCDLPDDERSILEKQGIRSIAALPLFLGDRWWGFLGFNDCTNEREWSSVEMEALSVVAGTLSASLSRKYAEMRLHQTSERLSVVLESLPIVTFTAKAGEQGEITYITGSVEEITGFRSQEFLKEQDFLMDHIHPDDRSVLHGCRLGIDSKGMCRCEFRFRAANGSYRWFSEFCRLIHGSEGATDRIVGMWQDVTEEKRILKESNIRLQQVIQAHKLASLGEIVAGVVHEINNPNSFIAYNIPLLEEIWKLCEPVVAEYAGANPGWGKRNVSFEELRDDMAEIINAFRIGSDRINRVVSNLKDFARVEEDVQAKPVSVNDVVEKTLMIVGGQVRRSVSKLDLHLDGDLPRVQGHFQKLEQVVANLLVNAHQAVQDKKRGRIRVSTRYLRRLASVVVTIEDNGSGMTRSIIDRLFEPFFTTRRNTGGTGLGLSVSYGLIQEHHGVIGVLSRPGIGSRFTVFIPTERGTPLNLRPLILPLESDLDRLDELQAEVSGIDDGFVQWFYSPEPSKARLATYLDQHPEVDILLMMEPPPGLEAGTILRMIREKYPLITTVAWGFAEDEFNGESGERPDVCVKGMRDIKEIKRVLEGITRQRF